MATAASRCVRDRTKTTRLTCGNPEPRLVRDRTTHCSIMTGGQLLESSRHWQLVVKKTQYSGGLFHLSQVGTSALPHCQIIHSLSKGSCYCGRPFVRSRTSVRAIGDTRSCDGVHNIVRSRIRVQAKLLDSGESFDRTGALTSVTQYNSSNAACGGGVLDSNGKEKGRGGTTQCIHRTTLHALILGSKAFLATIPQAERRDANASFTPNTRVCQTRSSFTNRR